MSYKPDLIPIGSIIAWSGGYFTAGNNGGTYTSVLGNTVANANAYLESKGYKVCDGSSLNLSTSPIFNGVSRFLPNLTDSRFLQGSTTTGSVGGQNNVTLSTANLPSHTHTIDHDHGSHTHSINHDHGATATGAHTHTLDRIASPTGTSMAPSNSTGGYGTDYTTSSTTPTIDLPSFTGTSGGASVSFSGSSGSTGSGAAFENRPLYLNVIYIMRVN